MKFLACSEEDRERATQSCCEEIPAENGMAYVGRIIDKPWGRETQLFAVPHVSVWRLNIIGNQETSLHCHQRKDVLFIVEAGELEIETSDDSLHLHEGDSAMIERGVFHRLRAWPFGTVLLEVEAPADKHDLLRVDDRYGRSGQAYPPQIALHSG